MNGDISPMLGKVQLHSKTSLFEKLVGYVRPAAARTIPRTPETEDMYRLRDELSNTGVPIESANVIAREIFKLQGRVYVTEAALTTLVALPERVTRLETRKK